MATYMRSNDAYVGLPHDIFAFTMLQELIARSIDAELGSYHHMAGSLHLYDKKRALASAYVDEGCQPTVDIAMPRMPTGDPWPGLNQLVSAEALIRTTGSAQSIEMPPDDYWADLVRLLIGYRLLSDDKVKDALKLRAELKSNLYGIYFTRLKDRKQKKKNSFVPQQMELPTEGD